MEAHRVMSLHQLREAARLDISILYHSALFASERDVAERCALASATKAGQRPARATSSLSEDASMPRTKLKPEVQPKIVSQIHLGNLRKHAVEPAGINEKTLKDWMCWGQLEYAKQPYRSFAEAVLGSSEARVGVRKKETGR